jgi:1-acyl-sn-glycerol-3-phosphate acyltransferase
MASSAGERIAELIREVMGASVDDRDLTLEALGVDSLAMIEVCVAAEREGIDLRALGVGGASSVGDVVRAIDGVWPAVRALPAGGTLQGFARAVGGPFFRWWFDLVVAGPEHVPASGPVVLAMNHEGSLDIPISVVACPRPITFMAKRELYKNAPVAWALDHLGGFRVDRERYDLAAANTALTVLRRGGVLGMYPEGTRAPGRLLPFLPCAAWVALATGAPLVPCILDGTERAREARWPRRVPIRVTFRPPVVAERVDDVRERRTRAERVTADLQRVIADGLSRADGPA